MLPIYAQKFAGIISWYLLIRITCMDASLDCVTLETTQLFIINPIQEIN